MNEDTQEKIEYLIFNEFSTFFLESKNVVKILGSFDKNVFDNKFLEFLQGKIKDMENIFIKEKY